MRAAIHDRYGPPDVLRIDDVERPVPKVNEVLVRVEATTVKELIEAGEYRPVVDRSYPLEEVVEAHRYVETLQKTGNVVLTVREATA